MLISPLANPVARPGAEAYGILTGLAHREFDRLYTEHARDKLGGGYLPEAVLVHTEGGPRPAPCYLSHDMAPGDSDAAYVDHILAPARDYGFPAGYLAHIESFRRG